MDLKKLKLILNNVIAGKELKVNFIDNYFGMLKRSNFER